MYPAETNKKRKKKPKNKNQKQEGNQRKVLNTKYYIYTYIHPYEYMTHDPSI